MAHYIIIDRSSGYIFFDTRDLPRDHIIDGEAMRDTELTPTLACRWGDEAVASSYGAEYAETNSDDPAATYDVYRVDIDGSEAVALVHDGQGQETINAVERSCLHVATVKVTQDEKL